MILVSSTGQEKAYAQSGAAGKELADLYAGLSRPDTAVSVEEATRCGEKLAQLALKSEDLSPTDRAWLGCVEVYIAAARGDAAAALARAQQLLKDFPEDHDVQVAAYVAACAAGDAQLAYDAGGKLAQGADSEQRRVWSARRRWLRQVGEAAPDVEIRAADGTAFQTQRRNNRVLLIDFWNMLEKPDDTLSALLRTTYKEYRSTVYFDMVGVNADAEGRLADAQAFAKQAGYEWPQAYEKTSTNAPITHEAFHAGNPPWLVLIDAYGYVRAAGTATEPGFLYALRAAVAENEGRFAAVLPRTRAGVQAQVAKVEIAAATDKKDAGDQDLPSNAEAASKLRQARAFLRTGLKTKAKELLEEIVRDYPGTREAQEAQEYLDTSWSP